MYVVKKINPILRCFIKFALSNNSFFFDSSNYIIVILSLNSNHNCRN